MRSPSGINVEVGDGGAAPSDDEAVCNSEKIKVKIEPAIAAKAGILTVEVMKQKVSETLTANAETAFPADAYARLCPKVPGTIVEVAKKEGDEVKKGDTLAVLDSVELAGAKSAYRKAFAVRKLRERTVAVEKDLVSKGASAGNVLAQAETELEEARIEESSAAQRLGNLGLPAAEVERVEREDDTTGRMPILAPFDGVVVERSAVLGEVAGTDRVLFAVADLSQMWLTIHVYEKELPKLKVDQRVTFTVEGMDSKVVRGKVISIGAAVDDRTRTIPVRASLKNKERLLRANMFGRAAVVVHDEEEVLVLPREAVQWEGCHNVVFVRIGPSTYQTRKVDLGWAGKDHVEVRSGVVAGDAVVTQGSFLMKTEILKGTIGAGCCD